MTNTERAGLLIQGKTKAIWSTRDDPSIVIAENLDDITAFDDPKFTKKFFGKAKCSTTVTCRVFELLREADIPVAYIGQFSPTEFIAQKCEMYPLEVVTRRFAVKGSSVIKRQPELARSDGQAPYRFEHLPIEFYLKTTRGKLLDCQGNTVVDGLRPEEGEEDPLIINPYDMRWSLFHPKKPIGDPASNLGREVDLTRVVPNGLPYVMEIMGVILRQAFTALESVWLTFGYRLIDMKVEYGKSQDGFIRLADVIDNDAWRLMSLDFSYDLSKQAFRDGKPLESVRERYELVAAMSEKFRRNN